jgi:Pyruvate/2-oxoacid:ferredoxin oxidoreductase delta subunit
MKALLVFLFASCVLASDFAQFNDFIVKYEKKYDSLEEFQYRFEVFKTTLAKIDRQNAAHVALGGEAVFGVNALADLTAEEFSNRLMKDLPPPAPQVGELPIPMPRLLGDVDWRTKNVVTPVKDQGNCGSCWAFSATEAIESFDALRYNRTTPYVLSAQQCTACTYNYNGCNGGWPHDAYVTGVEDRNGIDSNADYPYNIPEAGMCKFGATGNADKPQTDDNNYKSPLQGQLQTSLDNYGPVSVCVAAESWQTYTGGIMKTCTGSVDHCVQAVGYKTSVSEPYWIVRNSWGTSWGDKGYIYLDMTANNGDICHIQEYMTYPIIV